MITISTYTDAGSIVAVLTVCDHDEAKANTPENGGYVVGSYMPDQYKMVNGVPVEVSETKTYEQKCASIRNLRNKMLSGCDWTQVSDAPVDHDAWAIYRQELRNITNQDGFPDSVNWPAQPV
jgi:hypothetical protein|tara:strand:- start:225 stop:590 length:366 start_codon:yes stop_codon:yes gene_type:complete